MIILNNINIEKGYADVYIINTTFGRIEAYREDWTPKPIVLQIYLKLDLKW